MSRSANPTTVPFAVRRAMLTSRLGGFAWLLLVVRASRKRVRRVRREAREIFTMRDIFDGEWPYFEAPQPDWCAAPTPQP